MEDSSFTFRGQRRWEIKITDVLSEDIDVYNFFTLPLTNNFTPSIIKPDHDN